jgi:hypothetical protein
VQREPNQQAGKSGHLAKFIHHPGVHCGSTALMNVLRFHGHNFSEAMCFGLAGGLDFMYVESEHLSPSRMFNGRSASLEPVLFENIGQAKTWNTSPSFPWEPMKREILAQRPVLILTDLFYLDYYETKTHFGGHAVVLAGFDEDRETAYLADTERPGLQNTSIRSLARAMSSKESFYPLQNHWMGIGPIQPFDIEQAVRQALVRNAERYLRPASPASGAEGLRLFSERLPRWDQAKDWSWCARFGYQVIEKRGTGGAAFRKLYSDFLAEAEQLPATSVLRTIHASSRMRVVADLWTSFALELKRISESETPGFHTLQSIAEHIYHEETALFREIHGLFTA